MWWRCLWLASEVYGLYWQSGRDDSFGNDLGSLRSLDNIVSKHSRHYSRGFRVCICHQILAIFGVQVFRRSRHLWCILPYVYPVGWVRGSSISTAFPNGHVVRVFNSFTRPSIDGVFRPDLENFDDTVHRTVDICPRVLEVSIFYCNWFGAVVQWICLCVMYVRMAVTPFWRAYVWWRRMLNFSIFLSYTVSLLITAADRVILAVVK